jgi:hypothetical protein
MLELFPDQPVYEYPALVNVIYCFVWAFVLSAHYCRYTQAHVYR